MTTRTWSVTASTTDWGDTPSAANANWVLAFTPSSAEDAVIGSGAPGDVSIEAGHAYCKSLDLTGFPGDFICGDYSVFIKDFLMMPTAAPYTNFHVLQDDNLLVTSNGSIITDLRQNTLAPGKTLTLADDWRGAQLLLGQAGTIFAMGANKAYCGPVAETDVQTSFIDVTITYSAGAKIIYDIPNGVVGGFSFLTMINVTGNIPPLEINGTGDATLKPFGLKTASLLLNSGKYFPLGDTSTIAGNMTLAGGSIDLWRNANNVFNVGGNFNSVIDLVGYSPDNPTVFNVVGTATAHDHIVHNCNFTGTALDATDGCLDAGGNVHATFDPANALMWVGPTSTQTDDPTNWNFNIIPDDDARVNIIINGTAPGDVQGNIICKNINFTGFTGNYEGQIQTYGNALYAAGMTLSNSVHTFNADGTLDTAGLTLEELDVQACVMTLLSNVAISEALFSYDSGNGIAFGTKTVTLDVGTNESGFYFSDDSLLTYSAGAKLIGICAPSGYIDVQTDGDTVTPPVEVSGGGQLYMYPDVSMASLLVTGGGAYLETETYNIIGNATFIGGEFSQHTGVHDMFGATLVVGGNLAISGMTALNNGTLDVTGTGTITGPCVLTDMTTTGTITCTNCTNGSGNTGDFVFVAGPVASGTHRGFFAMV